MEPALRVRIEQFGSLLEMRDQPIPECPPFIGTADRVEFERDVGEAEPLPQALHHDEHFDVDVRARKPERLGAERVIFTVAPLLRTFVTEQRAAVPEPLRPVVEQIVLERGAHRRCGSLRAQRQVLAIVVERVHFLFDDIGHLAHAAYEEFGLLDDGRADVAVAVLTEHVADGVLEIFPERCLVGQHIVHAAHGLQCLCHDVPS